METYQRMCVCVTLYTCIHMSVYVFEFVLYVAYCMWHMAYGMWHIAYVYIYIYVYVYYLYQYMICICISISVLHVCMHACMYAYACMHVCIYAYMSIPVNTYQYINVHNNTHLYHHVHIYYIYIYITSWFPTVVAWTSCNPRHLLAMRLAAGLAPMHLLLAALTGAFQQGPQRDFEHDLTSATGESGWRNTDFTSQHWNLMGSYYGI